MSFLPSSSLLVDHITRYARSSRLEYNKVLYTSSLRELLNIDRENSSRKGLKEYGRARWLNVLEREYVLLTTG
jgi:hypothetical protein